jgi:hypothetical protein
MALSCRRLSAVFGLCWIVALELLLLVQLSLGAGLTFLNRRHKTIGLGLYITPVLLYRYFIDRCYGMDCLRGSRWWIGTIIVRKKGGLVAATSGTSPAYSRGSG